MPGLGGQPTFDQTKPWGRGQQAPLTPEYQAIFEANLKDQAEGGQGTTPTYTCLSPGMPRATNGYGEIEFVVTPDTTYIFNSTSMTARSEGESRTSSTNGDG